MNIDVSLYIENGIKDCKTFNDLLLLVDSIKPEEGLNGSHKFYNKIDLLRVLVLVESRGLTVDYITRTAGLRNAVINLLNK